MKNRLLPERCLFPRNAMLVLIPSIMLFGIGCSNSYQKMNSETLPTSNKNEKVMEQKIGKDFGEKYGRKA